MYMKEFFFSKVAYTKNSASYVDSFFKSLKDF